MPISLQKNDARMTKSKNKLVQQQIRNNQIIRPISEIFGLDKWVIRAKFFGLIFQCNCFTFFAQPGKNFCIFHIGCKIFFSSGSFFRSYNSSGALINLYRKYFHLSVLMASLEGISGLSHKCSNKIASLFKLVLLFTNKGVRLLPDSFWEH